VITAAVARLHLYVDMTENRRNSFPAADAAALAALPERLTDRNRQYRLLRRVADAPDRLGDSGRNSAVRIAHRQAESCQCLYRRFRAAAQRDRADGLVELGDQ
jgi:hypothetical protein